MARIVTYLPMAHVTGRTLDHWGPMTHPATLAYCPDHLRLFEIAAQVHPTFLMGIPRVWEKLHAALRGALPDVSPAAVRALPDEVKAGGAHPDRPGPVPDRGDRRRRRSTRRSSSSSARSACR